MIVQALLRVYRLIRWISRTRSTLIGQAKLRLWGRARLGRGVRIGGPIRVKVSPGGTVRIGDGVRFLSGFYNNPVGSECVNSIFVGPRATLQIGDGAGISACSIVCMESITIGPRTYIGGGARIFDTDFHSLDPQVRVHGDDDQVRTAPVVIGAECFIGGYSMVLKGVRIGDQAVIGAAAVVAREVPPRQIWGGNPAKFIKDLPHGPSG